MSDKYIHLKNCKCKSKKLPLTPKNPWWVNAPQFHNCFWSYLSFNSKNHTLSEVANLLDLSISAITSIEKKAFNKMRIRMRHLNLQEK